MSNPLTNRWHDVYHANLLAVLLAPLMMIVNHTFKIMNPLDLTIDSVARGFKAEFTEAFVEWVFSGEPDIPEHLLALNPNAVNYETVLEREEAENICVAYGTRMQEQMAYVARELERFPESRRACIMFLDSEDLHVADALAEGDTKCEYICTMGLTFTIRGGKLDCVATMRSNNYATTVMQDVVLFTAIQCKLAEQLGVGVGVYYHSAVSAHISGKDFERAIAILKEYLYHPARRERTEAGRLAYERAIADGRFNNVG